MEVVKRCRNCRKLSTKMSSCGQCREVYYCSRDCQRLDWPKHKQNCDTEEKNCHYYTKRIRKNRTYNLIATALSAIRRDTNQERIILVKYIFGESYPHAYFSYHYIPKEEADNWRKQENFVQSSVLEFIHIFDGEKYCGFKLASREYGENLERLQGLPEATHTTENKLDSATVDLETDFMIIHKHNPEDITKMIQFLSSLPLTVKEPLLIRFTEKDFL